MSVEDVSIKSIIVDGAAVSQTNSGSRIGNALSTGNTGASVQETDNKKNNADKLIDDIVNSYKISREEIISFLYKIGYSTEKISDMSKKEISTLSRLLNSLMDFIICNSVNEDNDTKKSAKLNDAAKIINLLKNNNVPLDRISNSVEEIENYNLFSLLKLLFPTELGDAKSLKDVNPDVLEQCIAKVFEKTKNISLEKLDLFKTLLNNTSDEDYKLLYNAFIKISKDENEQISGLVALIGKLKNPKELENFINNDLAKICTKYGLNIDTTQKIVREIAKTAKETGLNSKELLVKLLDRLAPENLYNIIKEKEKNGEEITKEEKELLYSYDQYIKIKEKEKSGGNITGPERTFLTEFEAKIESIRAAIVAAISGENPDEVKDLIQVAQDYGISKDAIIQQIIEFSKKFNDYNIDKDILDNATNGAYSKALSEYESNNNEYTASSYGYSNTSSEAYNSAVNNLQILKSQVVEEKPEAPVVETKTKKSADEKPGIIKTQVLKSAESFNYAIAQGIIKIDDAGKDFEKACQSVQQKVISYLQVQKNNRLDLINKWHNSKLAEVAANKFNFTKAQIEELQLSIGKKQVMVHNYEQKHQHEEEEE